MNTNPSQSARILAHLRLYTNRWVRLPELVQASGAYAVHSRVAELRKRGHVIENRTDREHGRTEKWSYYRLKV